MKNNKSLLQVKMFCKFVVLSAVFLHYYVKSASVVRTVAANGQGVDIRGCGVEGNIYCNTTQFAIFESNDGDEIVLLKGIHTCDSNITTDAYGYKDGGIRFVQRDGTTAISGIFIHGAINTRNDDFIYDCKHTKRAFAFMSESEGMNTVLSTFVISNGSAYAGGGVYIQSQAKPIINRVTWVRNEAQIAGGGVFITDSNTKATFNNCTFQENKAQNNNNGGGGVYIQLQATPKFNHVIWIRNVVQGYGGGVLITGSYTNPTFNNCTFQENNAPNSNHGGGGGGVFIASSAKPTFNHVVWIGNVAHGGGAAAIQDSNTNPAFNNCTFQENYAPNINKGGGGIYINSQAQPIFNHVIWIRNLAQGYGGGVYISDFNTNPTFNNCTFQNNTGIEGGGAIRLPFYPDKPSIIGECGTSLNFTSKIIFANNKANYNAGNSIYIDIIQPTSVKTPMEVHFATTCFHNKFITYTNNNNYKKQHTNIKFNVATSPYKLAISKPGTLIPTSIAPGIQLKGSLQVQDVFGRSCTEIEDHDYSATVRLRNDKQIKFQGSTVFLIRESGIANISYLNQLKITSAPFNLIGKQIALQFTQEKLQPVNTTITLSQCKKGFQSSPKSNGVLTCNLCPAQQYNVISGGMCHDCPTTGAVCMGRDDVYVQPGYYGHVGHIDTHHGEISLFECSGGQCCPHFNGTSLETYDINGIGCRIGSGYDCAKNRDPSIPLCGSCVPGYSEVLGSSICRKCTYINWFWFIIPFPVGMMFIVYLLRKTYLAGTKNILFTLIFKNLMFFYQVVGLVLIPSQLVKRVSGPLLMLFSFNVATNEADHSDSNNYNKTMSENPFNCLVPNLTPIGKLTFNIYPMGILILLCWPICIYIFRKNEEKRANFGPAIITCLLSLYASMTKFLIQLINCRPVENKLILYSAPKIICFKGTSWVWQLFAIIGIIFIALVPYLLYRYAKLKLEEDGLKNNRWMLVVTKSYRDECWWYTSIDMGRRLFLISIAALPMNHENKLVMLTIGFLVVRTFHVYLKPFPHIYLNFAEDSCLSLLVIISAISSSRAASLHKNTDGTYDHPMDPFLLILVMCPFVGSIFFSAWYMYMERKKGNKDESTTEDSNSINRTWAPNPLENVLKNNCGESRKTKRRTSDIELVVDGLGEFHLDALEDGE